MQRDRFDFGTLDHHSKGDSIEAFSSSFNPTGRQNITNCRVSWLSVFSVTLHVKPEIKVQRGRCDFGTLDHHSNGNSIEVFFVKFQPDWSSKHYKMQGFGSLWLSMGSLKSKCRGVDLNLAHLIITQMENQLKLFCQISTLLVVKTLQNAGFLSLVLSLWLSMRSLKSKYKDNTMVCCCKIDWKHQNRR